MNIEKFMAISELYLEMAAKSSRDVSRFELEILLNYDDDLDMFADIPVTRIGRKVEKWEIGKVGKQLKRPVREPWITGHVQKWKPANSESFL